mmetsp:Transcript_15450/g.35295  ORF Transcript_15450/g.35295 Transcript_15450/m.35295 type:complete len:268 (-) Transcript_15450:33-836(-)
MATEDYYAVLQIPRNATEDVITHAYRQQALLWHPDKHKGSHEAEEHFKLVSQAYQALSNPDRRAHYDQQLLGAGERRQSLGKDAPIVWTKKYGWSSFNISFGWIGEPEMPDIPAAVATQAATPTSAHGSRQPSKQERPGNVDLTASMASAAEEVGEADLFASVGAPASGSGSPRVEECIGLPSHKAGTCGSSTSKGPLANPFTGFREVLGLDEAMGRFIQSMRISSCGGEEERRTAGGPWAEEIYNADEVSKIAPPGSSHGAPVESW